MKKIIRVFRDSFKPEESGKLNLKKIIAREFILLFFVGVILGTPAIIINRYFSFKADEPALNRLSQQRVAELSALQYKLPIKYSFWSRLKHFGVYSNDYSQFINEHRTVHSQRILWRISVNRDLYTLPFTDFRKKYFESEWTRDQYFVLHNIYFNRNHFLNDGKILRQFYEEFVEKYRYSKSFKSFKLLVFRNDEITEKQKNILDTTNNNIKKTDEKISEISKYIKIEVAYNKWIIQVVSFILIITYPLRFLILMLKWSFKNIKPKK